MKNKTLGNLLRSIELSKESNENNIINLNDMMLSKMLIGGYLVVNTHCSRSNASCENIQCFGTTDQVCWNHD
jgi:hypothetical protein